MTQFSLFGDGPRTLLDDASGRIEYRPALIDGPTAGRWFTRLHNDIEWRGERRMMYEREVDVPRLTAQFRFDDRGLHDVLHEAFVQVRGIVGAPFDSVGLNLYRDRNDSVAPHNDTLRCLAQGQPIALLSLGATRRMIIRAKLPPRLTLQIDLEAGSLLVMNYATQLHHDHGIPKQRTPAGARISMAFRVRERSQGSL